MSIVARNLSVAALGVAGALTLAACGGGGTSAGPTGSASAASGGKTKVTMWTHNAGNEVELKLVQQVTDDYNASQDKYEITVQAFPQASYNDAIVAASASKSLPCLLDVDAPIMPSWAYADYLQPLTIDAKATDPLLPGVKGTYNDKLYSVGFYDAALGILTRKSILEDNDIRIPTIDQPWTLEEFDAALAKLKASDKYDYPLDLGTGWTAEWYPYAYAPLLQSFGGDLINRADFSTAEGVLNGPQAVKWGQWFQGLFKNKLANPKESADRTAFLQGKVAMQWNGSWGVGDAVKKFDEDTLILPPPNLGKQPYIGAGSWQWGMSATCQTPEAVNGWISFGLQDKYLSAFSEQLGNLPASAGAQALGKKFKEGTKEHTYIALARKYALIRPPTPAYPFISKTFEKAALDIIAGANVQDTLNTAVDAIDKNLAENNNYQ